jgi:hypothetical protein
MTACISGREGHPSSRKPASRRGSRSSVSPTGSSVGTVGPGHGVPQLPSGARDALEEGVAASGHQHPPALARDPLLVGGVLQHRLGPGDVEAAVGERQLPRVAPDDVTRVRALGALADGSVRLAEALRRVERREGVRLFESPGTPEVELRKTRTVDAGQITDLLFEVTR